MSSDLSSPTLKPPVARRPVLVPVLAPLVRSRGVSLMLAAAGTLQVTATLLHWPAMRCPMMELFHIPCPGCGASRACAALLRRDWPLSIELHAFAPMLLAAIGIFWLAGVLPSSARARLGQRMEHFERRTALPTLLLIALVLYWIARLLYAPAAFIHLVST